MCRGTMARSSSARPAATECFDFGAGEACVCTISSLPELMSWSWLLLNASRAYDTTIYRKSKSLARRETICVREPAADSNFLGTAARY